jgi:hypothetical protein
LIRNILLFLGFGQDGFKLIKGSSEDLTQTEENKVHRFFIVLFYILLAMVIIYIIYGLLK